MTSSWLKRLSSLEDPRTQDSLGIRVAGLQSLQLAITAMGDLVDALANELGPHFEASVKLILETKGRVIVSGVGKSGHIGCKIASTLASTGTPAFFVHPTEASHGDLGMIKSEDTILALSSSGESTELGDLIRFSRRLHIPLIAVTSDSKSMLGVSADVVLALPKVQEACPYDLAPTSSSLLQLAIGDGLAIALMKQRGFSLSSFEIIHPGGKLATRLTTVHALMHGGKEMPVVQCDAVMSDVLLAMTAGHFGCVGVVDANLRLVGIVTDGDLRRHMGKDLLTMSVDDVMTVAPVTVNPTSLASAALELMNSKQITAIFVVEESRPMGILHIHDLIRAGVS
jgi:arabinose-5-phosphate isomerase